MITQLGVGEALISLLDETGTPAQVERGFVLPPSSRVGPITLQERQQVVQSSVLYGHYEKSIDRESAYERLKGRAETPTKQQPTAPAPAPQYSAPIPAQSPQSNWTDTVGSVLGAFGGGGRRQGLAETMAKSAVRAIGSQVGRQIVRGVLGGILGGSSSRSRY